MKEDVRQDIIGVLDTVAEILSFESWEGLKDVSDHSLRTASLHQDDDSISIATLIYAISKLMERHAVKDVEPMIEKLLGAKEDLKALRLDHYHMQIATLFRMILRIDNKLSHYVELIIDKAKKNKGTKMVSQGISVERAASLLGISQWELMSVVGKTMMIDEESPISNVKARMRLMREIFS